MHIMVVDDEKILSSLLQKKLEKNDYTVTLLHSYASYLEEAEKDIDLYIIDISLGDGSGFDIIKKIRSNSATLDTPILLMSGMDDTGTKVEGLDIGADDYIVKPFDSEEILARVRTLMRRKNPTVHTGDITYKNISLNIASRGVTLNGKQVDLTKKEKQIFEFFIRNQERLITKDEIIEKLWGKKAGTTTDNTINVTLCNLRKKLGEEFNLVTKVGEGHILHK